MQIKLSNFTIYIPKAKNNKKYNHNYTNTKLNIYYYIILFNK